MGLIDNIRGFFSSSTNTEPVKTESIYEKRDKIDQIIELKRRISKKTLVDNSVNWPLSENTLMGKSLDELNEIISNLKGKLEHLQELEKQNANRNNDAREALAKGLWTGELPKDMTTHDLDFAQRVDDR